MNEAFSSPYMLQEDGRFKNRGVEVINAAGIEPGSTKEREVAQWLQNIPATRLTVYHDVSPTESRRVPTGVKAEFDPEKNPHWLKFVRGADIGCGIVAVKLQNVKFNDFIEKGQAMLDSIYAISEERRNECAIGGGNHFIDFAYNSSGDIFVLVHTGSFGDQQNQLSQFINPEHGVYDEKGYWRKYDLVVDSGINNRGGILKIILKVCGPFTIISDTQHNTADKERATIYKGVVRVDKPTVTKPAGLFCLPSSMVGDILIYSAGSGAEALGGVPHGTGRAVARSLLKGPKVDPRKIGLMTPIGLLLPPTEMPHAYNPIELAVATMSANGLLSEIIDVLTPVAYIGHM